MANLVNKTKMREVVGKDFRVSMEFDEAIDIKVSDMIRAAMDRCEKNNRKTLRPEDL